MLSLIRNKRNVKLGTTKQMLDVGGRHIQLTIKPNPRAKRMTLRIEPGGRGLKLSAPPHVKQHDIDDFLVRYHGWILTNLAKFPVDTALKDGGVIQIRGIEHSIVRTGQLRGLAYAEHDDKGRHFLYVPGDQAHLGRRVADFLKKEAKIDLERSVIYHCGKICKTYRSLTLRDTRSRWGSCSSDGKLSFSWRIIMAPPFVIDYLAAHEVSHLQEMNHEPQFWALCKELCPHTDEAKRWLKSHGSLLHAIDFSA